MPDPNLASTLPPNPDLNQPMPNPAPQPANLPQPGLRSIIPASWSGGFLPQRQVMSQPAPQFNLPSIREEPERLDSPQEIDPEDPRSSVSSSIMPWRTPYISARARPSGQAGSEYWPITGAANYPGTDPGPAMPNFTEALGIIGRGGRTASMFAPPSASPYYGRASQLAMQISPIMDIISKGKFSKYYLQEKRGQLELMQEEMLMQQQQALQAHQASLAKYADIFNRYNLGGYKDDQQAIADLEVLGQSDPNFLAVLHNQGVAAAEEYIVNQDKLYRDQLAAYTTAKKSKDASSGGGEDAWGEGGPGTTIPGFIAPKTAAAAATPAATSTATSQTESDAEIAKAHHAPDGRPLSDSSMEQAHGVARQDPSALAELRGRKSGDLGRQAIGNAAADISSRLNRAAADRSKTPGQRLADIGNIDSTAGADVKGLRDYSINPRDPNVKYALPLARAIGGYDENKFTQAQTFVKGANANRLQSAYGQRTAFESLLRATLDRPEDTFITRNQLEKWARGERGDPQFSDLFQAMNELAVETASIQGGGSTVRVTLVNNMLAHMKDTASMAQIRGQAQIMLRNSYGFVDGMNRRWKSTITPDRNVPGWDPDLVSWYSAVNRMNPNNQVMPQEAPPSLKSLGKTGKEIGGWARKGVDDYTPIESEELLRNYVQFVTDNRDSQDQLTIERMKKIYRRLRHVDMIPSTNIPFSETGQ